MNFLKYPNKCLLRTYPTFFKAAPSQAFSMRMNSRLFKNLHHQSLQCFSKGYHKPHKPWPRPPDYKKKRLIFTYYNVGLYCLIFGICYSIVPLYKLFCEHVGLEGDLEQKDYSMKDKKRQISFLYKITFP